MLIAGITASYIPYPLHLKSYDDFHQERYGTGTNNYQNLMAIPMGRYTINTNGETIYSIAIHSDISKEFELEGRTTWNPSIIQSIGFHPVAILKTGSTLFNTNLWEGQLNPLNPRNTALSGTITIDFYLISYQAPSVFIPNEKYSLIVGTMGTFYASYLDENISVQSGLNIPFPDTNGNPIAQQPYLDGGLVNPDDKIIYGDPPDQEHYDFRIFNELPVDITSASGSNKAQVATAQVTLSSADPAKSYGITLTFTNATNTHPFRMTLTDNLPNPPSIAYHLFFNDTLVTTPGDSVDWDDLSNSTFTKHIYITGIDETSAATLPHGSYKDTVYVNITAKDTI